jgi:flagellar biosynthesis/type III secretory pathway M-ring protein FliF/YscJ
MPGAATTTATPTAAVTEPNMAALQKFMQQYGQLAFGTVVMLVMWFFIVEPAMERNRVDVDKVAEITESQREMATVLKQTADSLGQTGESQRDAALLLKQTADRLERVADKLEGRAP